MPFMHTEFIKCCSCFLIHWNTLADVPWSCFPIGVYLGINTTLSVTHLPHPPTTISGWISRLSGTHLKAARHQRGSSRPRVCSATEISSCTFVKRGSNTVTLNEESASCWAGNPSMLQGQTGRLQRCLYWCIFLPVLVISGRRIEAE